MPSADAGTAPTEYAPPAIDLEPDAQVDRAAGAAEPSCVECGSPVAGRYCAQCGEARRVDGRLRMRHLAGEFFEHLTSLDFRVVRTLSALVRRPGSLTLDFVAGRRNRYTRPLALYLLVSGGFFLLSPHLPGTLYDPTVTITSAVSRSPVTSPRTTAGLLAPVIAGVVALLLLRRRRLLAEHVLFAIHLQTFLLVHAAVTMASFAAIGRIGGAVARALDVPASAERFKGIVVAVIVLSAAILLRHVVSALRNVYGLGRVGAAWRAVLLLGAIPLGLAFGRMALVYLAALTRLS
jgi:hypothetical protein